MTVDNVAASALSPQWKPRQAALDHNRYPPSFAYKAREVLRHRALTPDHPRWRVTEKLGAYLLLDRLGVPHAEVYDVIRGHQTLTPRHLSRPVVLKPLFGESARGVFYLCPDGDGWINRLNGRRLGLNKIHNRLREVVEDRGFPDIWIIEEPLTPAGIESPSGPVADDYKVYTFQGEVGLILQRRAWAGEGRRFRWFDPDWQPVSTGKYSEIIDNALSPPPDPAQLLEVARRVSRAVPLPFCRVDAYVTDRGVRVGEINGWTGGYDKFDDHWDQHLGAMWESAEVRVPTRWPFVSASAVAGAYPVPRWRRLSGPMSALAQP